MGRTTPDAVDRIYYPSLVLNLQILFDGDLMVEPRSAKELAESGTTGPDPAVDEPLILARGNNRFSYIIGLIPKSCSVELQGYRQASTFSFELEYKDLPIDPRVIRQMAVAIHLDTVTPTEFSFGMEGRSSLGRPRSVAQAREDNLLVAGMADGIDVDHSDRGSTIRVEGRDLRGLMLDMSIHPETLEALDPMINSKKDIGKLIAFLVHNKMPLGKKIDVVVNAGDWPNGVVPYPYVKGDVTRVNKSAKGDKMNASIKGDAQGVKFWDLITQLCFFSGAVPYFVGSKLVIRPATTLYDAIRQESQKTNVYDPSVPIPFAGGQKRELSPPKVEKTELFTFRRLVFGRDIGSLKYERKLGGVKVPAVEFYCVDPDGIHKGAKNRRVSGRWPPASDADANATEASMDGGNASTETIYVRAPVGIRNRDRLQEMAKAMHREIGRQEMGGSISTKSLASFGGDNQDPDLLRLRPGDAVEFRPAASGLNVFPPPVHELNSHEQSYAQEVKAVKARIGDENLARAIVASNQGRLVDLQRTFRVANVKYTWSAESGVSLDFDFQNYVESRFDEKAGAVPELVPIPPNLVPLPGGG